jgi:hypothetical protein
MSARKAILALGTACSTCGGKGINCKACYTVGLKGVAGLGISKFRGNVYTVSASLLSSDGKPLTLHWNHVNLVWCEGPNPPLQCFCPTEGQARNIKTAILVSTEHLKAVSLPKDTKRHTSRKSSFTAGSTPRVGRPASV